MTVDPDRHYEIAKRTLDLDPNADASAAERLAELLEGKDVIDPGSLRERFQDASVQVLGPVPGGAESTDPARPTIAAGSAVRQALSAGIQPTLVVSDLDGSDMGHEMFSRVGVPIGIHGHGDNVALLERLIPELEGPVFGTCQTPPPEGAAVELHRFGGFTDGDRACFLAAHLGAKRLELVGWDLEDPVSGGGAKQAKLDLAQGLLREVPIPVSMIRPDEPDVDLEDLVTDEGIGLSLDEGAKRDPESR